MYQKPHIFQSYYISTLWLVGTISKKRGGKELRLKKVVNFRDREKKWAKNLGYVIYEIDHACQINRMDELFC